jgi:hypothetical protein
MSWAALFERAAAYDVALEDVRAALADHREEQSDDGASK